jgi:Rrf2 family transcriptional regulator, cysteine metabolism repressor
MLSLNPSWLLGIREVLMKLSTKGRYGLRAMLDLALNSKDEAVSIKSISERQDISENYLEQIIATLKKMNYVQSVRGPKGGYVLNKQPVEIYLLAIF